MAATIDSVEAARQIDEETRLLTKSSEYDDLQDSPLKWPLWYKWTVVVLVELMVTLDIFGTFAIVPAVPQILQEFHVSNPLYLTLVVSIWELGEGIGPFIIAPLSEHYGRMPVYHVGNTLFVLCLVASATSTNISALIAFRFLSGLTTTCLTLGPSIIGDVFIQEERGKTMAVALLLQKLGPFGAPLLGSYVAQEKGWRCVIGIIAIAVGVLHVISLVSLRETYVPVLLRRQSKLCRNIVASKFQEIKAETAARHFQSLLRPLKMLCSSPMLFIVSFYIAVSYGLGYLLMTTMTPIFQSLYGLSLKDVGWAFLAQPTGNVLGIILYGMTSDRYLKYNIQRHGTAQPESRLLFMAIGSITLPIGFFVYGWTLAYSTYWMAPLFGTATIGFSLALIVLPIQNYLVDAFEDYAASAIAVSIIMQAMSGAFLPLAGPPLYSHLGYGWGNGLLGLFAAAFVPVTIATFRYGYLIRGDRRRWTN
ncbi:hypothetical protein MMC11_008786 [Xylographa trunciseda]|nr:hypothetical protein [Xylographa trunciseda]